MPKVSPKKAVKPKAIKAKAVTSLAGNDMPVDLTETETSEPVIEAPRSRPAASVVAEPESAPAQAPLKLEPPTRPVETQSEEPPLRPAAIAPGGKRDVIANSLNIAKLQAMSMNELNQMAKDLGVENFGTMRKHEVIFHILQKNAERSGVLFSEGVLEVLPEGFGFLRSQSFNYLPCPEDIYVSPSQIRRFRLCKPVI